MVYKAFSYNGISNPINNKWYSPYYEDAVMSGIDLKVALDKKLTRGEIVKLMVSSYILIFLNVVMNETGIFGDNRGGASKNEYVLN